MSNNQTTFWLSDIPELDPSEFNLYCAANRTGDYFWQRIIGETLDIGHMVNAWIPIGKTKDYNVLELSPSNCDIAIMYAWHDKPEHRLWFHLEIES